MKKQFLLLALALTNIASGQILRGRVTFQNSNHTPVQAAEVTSTGANPTVTDADGEFALTFAGKSAGDPVIISK